MNIRKMLADACESERVYEPGIDLIEEGVLDSLGIIMFFNALEDEGIEIPLSRVNKSLLHTVEGIEQIVASYTKNK